MAYPPLIVANAAPMTGNDLGMSIFVCKMSMDMMKLSEDDMVRYADSIIGAMVFMDYSKNAQVLFIWV